MPLYEYRCRVCHRVFELLRRINDADDGLECPDCHSEAVERLLSTFSAAGCGISGSRGFT
jgi:putative FmdB family regulatory protein